jgi:hypothetical protein
VSFALVSRIVELGHRSTLETSPEFPSRAAALPAHAAASPPQPLLMQNQHLAPRTQQAEQSWLNTRVGSEACQSIFLKLTKDEK